MPKEKNSCTPASVGVFLCPNFKTLSGLQNTERFIPFPEASIRPSGVFR